VATDWLVWMLTPAGALVGAAIGLSPAGIYLQQHALSASAFLYSLCSLDTFTSLASRRRHFTAALVGALARSNAKLRAMQRDNAPAEPKAVARFLSKAMTIKGPKLCGAKAWFHCSQFQKHLGK